MVLHVFNFSCGYGGGPVRGAMLGEESNCPEHCPCCKLKLLPYFAEFSGFESAIIETAYQDVQVSFSEKQGFCYV